MTRRFTEDEARRIFARVAERQQASGAAAAGLSLAELEEAAEAAGLDPALVAAAAADLDAGPARPGRRLLGAPVEASATRVVPGPLTDDLWAEIVTAARAEVRQPGMAGQIGQMREWTAVSGGTKNGVTTRLVAEPAAAGGVRLTLSQSVRDMALGFTIAAAIQAVLAVLFTVAAVASREAELLIPAAILAGMALLMGGGTQVGTRAWRRLRADSFDGLLDRFELLARASAPRADAAPEPDAAPAPRLSLDALPDAPDAPGGSAPASRLRS